jgi:pantothenate kinase
MNEKLTENLIKLESFENILVGIDIGGTLVKLSVAVTKNIDKETYLLLIEGEFEEIFLENNNLYIKQFSTLQFTSEVIYFLKVLKEKSLLNKIIVTGGGAYKFNDLIIVNEILL